MNSLLRSCFAVAAFAVTASFAAAAAESALEEGKYREGPWEDDIGYRQAVRSGNTLYISGSVGEGAMPDAIRGAYTTLEKTLKAYGLGFADVVKENIYTTNLDALKENLAVRKTFYKGEFPAATWVQVQRLYEPSHVIEVELIAVFPPGRTAKP